MPNIGVAERQTYDSQVRGKYLRVSNEDATLGVHDRVVIVDIDTASVTLTLPNVGEAAGKTFTISTENVTGAAGNGVTIQDNDESLNWSDITGTDDTKEQVAVLYSDGVSWFNLI